MMHPLKIVFSIVLCLSTIACWPDSDSAVYADLLIGRWEIKEALRDDTPTGSLSELYYEFIKDGTLKTNLAGSTEIGRYELTGENLQQLNTKIKAEYQVKTLNDSLLVLTTVLQNANFKFTLGRVIEEE